MQTCLGIEVAGVLGFCAVGLGICFATFRMIVRAQTVPVANPASYTMGTGSLSRGVKRLGRGLNHPLSFSAEVKERVQLCQAPGTFVAGSKVTFTIIIIIIIINATFDTAR